MHSQPLGIDDVQKYVWTMRVGLRPQYTRDKELRSGKVRAEHAHEGNPARRVT